MVALSQSSMIILGNQATNLSLTYIIDATIWGKRRNSSGKGAGDTMENDGDTPHLVEKNYLQVALASAQQ